MEKYNQMNLKVCEEKTDPHKEQIERSMREITYLHERALANPKQELLRRINLEDFI